MTDNRYYVFADVDSDCENPVADFLGVYPSKGEAEEIQEIFKEAYDRIDILEAND